MLQQGLLRKRALRAEERYLERLLLRETRRHDLAEKPHDLRVRKRPALPAVALQRHAQHLCLALGPIEIDRVTRRVLRDADLLRKLGPLIDQLVQLRIDVVDADANPFEPGLVGSSLCGGSRIRPRPAALCPRTGARLDFRCPSLPAGHGYSSRAPRTPGMPRSRASTSAGMGASVSISV